MKQMIVGTAAGALGFGALLGLAACADAPEQAETDAATETAGEPDTVAQQQQEQGSRSVLNRTMTSLGGEPVDLSQYHGSVVMIVNTASKCGLTPQYEGLQQLHETYADRGLVILGFPANDFGAQEPGSDEEIAAFCAANYGVGFPMFSKISVKGDDRHPLFAQLAELPEPLGGEPRWNFTKFVLDRSGEPVARFEPATEPTSSQVTARIEALLAAEG